MTDPVQVFEGKSSIEKVVEATDAVDEALYTALGAMPLATALGVLELVKHRLIEEHGD